MESNSSLLLLQFALRVVGAVVCYNQAQTLNRSAGGWAAAGFFVPVISMIVVFCMKRIPYSNEQPNQTTKPFTKYYTAIGIIEVQNTGERKVSINGSPAPNGTYNLNRFESVNVYDGKIKNQI